MKRRKSIELDLEELWKVIQEKGDTTSRELAEQFDCSSPKILSMVHDLESMHPGQIMISHQGIGVCLGKSKEDLERWLRCAGRNQSFIKRAKHIATNCLQPAQKRIGRALLLKALPEKRLLALESSIDFLAEQKRKQNEGVVEHFDFDQDGKMKRGYSAGAE